MAKKSARPLRQITVRIYEDDFEYLKNMTSTIAHNVIIRDVLSDFVQKSKAEVERLRRQRNETTKEV